ncbi:vomeronasal type-2 receptor 1-like [Dugong dugon]
MASDLKCSHMVSHLVLHSGWSWVGILAQDDDHGWKEVCTTKAILVFLSNSNFHLVLQGLLGSAVLGQVWVSQDMLHSVLALAIPGISQVLQGSFSLMPQHSQVLSFPKFLAHLHLTLTPEDMLTKKFWEVTFGCTWPSRSPGPAKNSTTIGGVQFHSKNESLGGQEYLFQNLLHHLWNVHFKTPHWKEIVFDVNGDIVTEFDILHGQKTPRTYSSQVPSSVSSMSCTPGFSQIPHQGTPHCCFECRPCPEEQFANQTERQIARSH